MPRSDAGPATASARSTSKPPMNTANRSNRRHAGTSSSSWLHMIAPRSERWRSGTSAAPAPGRSRRPSSRSWIAAGVRKRRRAAASSIASGTPPRWATIAATSAALAAVTAKPGLTEPPRATNSRTDSNPASASGDPERTPAGSCSRSSGPSRSRSGGEGRPGTGYSCSPEIRSGARLVAMIRTLPARRRSSPISVAAARTCSRLSRTRSACFDASSVPRTSIGERLGSSPIPMARAIAGITSVESVMVPRGTNQVPSGYSSTSDAATWSASRVLPVPPGPVSVTSRELATSVRVSSSSRSRPTNEVSSTGRLLGRASIERIGGKSPGRPSMSSWAIRSGRRSLRRWAPRDRRLRPGASRPSTSDEVTSESRTCPPLAADDTRAA